ncbi:hypothetical protein TB2_005070 [Malus domestica]
MELIRNAEDNEYEEGVEPTLEFVMAKKDITGSGAPATLLVFNNEVGFSRKNMDSICSVGRSTKKGKRQQGFIGEKGKLKEFCVVNLTTVVSTIPRVSTKPVVYFGSLMLESMCQLLLLKLQKVLFGCINTWNVLDHIASVCLFFTALGTVKLMKSGSFVQFIKFHIGAEVVGDCYAKCIDLSKDKEPVSKLSLAQTMYRFISGYTALVLDLTFDFL